MVKFIPPSWRGWAGVLSRIDWRPLLITAWGLALLYPVRETGWLQDDAFNASLPGAWLHNGTTPLSESWSEIVTWTFQSARINPVIHIWKNVSFWMIRDLYWYKWAEVAAVLVSLLVFYGCLRGMGADADFAGLGCLLTAGLIQFRALADPVIAFSGLLPMLLVLTALSLLLLHRHRVGGGRLALAGSVLLYAVAALTYEMTYVFWVFHAWVLLRGRAGWRRGARTLLPFVAVPVLLTLGSMVLRTRPAAQGREYRARLAAGPMADTFVKQLVAALPCSSAALDSTVPATGVFSWTTLAHYWPLAVFGLLLFGLLGARLIRRARQGGLELRWWTALGLLLAVLPVPMLCICAKYQGAFHYGFGYLPVYVEYFGVALLLAAGVAALGRLGRRVPAGLLALAVAAPCAAFAVFDYAGNILVVHVLRVPLLHPRCEIEEVVDAGLLRGVAPGGVLVADRLYPWGQYKGDVYFYCCHTHTRLADVLAPSTDADALRKAVPDQPGAGPTSDAVRVRYVNVAQPGGFVVAGRLCYAQLGLNGTLRESGLSGMLLAVWRGEKGNSQYDRPFIFHSCCWRPGGDPHRVDPVDLPSTALRWVRTTEHWTIYGIDTPYPYLDGEAAWLEFPPARAPSLSEPRP